MAEVEIFYIYSTGKIPVKEGNKVSRDYNLFEIYLKSAFGTNNNEKARYKDLLKIIPTANGKAFTGLLTFRFMIQGETRLYIRKI